MIQIFSNNTFLDLIYEEDITFNLTFEDVQDPTTKGSAYTQEFRLPSTDTNDLYFQTYYENLSVSFDPTIKLDAIILFNGILFKSGSLRLNAVLKNDAGGIVEYEVFFIGELGTLASELGDKTLCDLDTSDLEHTANFATIQSSWNYGLKNGDLVYGMIDWGYLYGGGCAPQCEPRITNNSALKPITNPIYPYEIKQWKPSLRYKYIFDKIFAGTNFTYESNFLSGSQSLIDPDKRFDRDLYMPLGNLASSKDLGVIDAKIVVPQDALDTNYSFSTSEIRVPHNLIWSQNIVGNWDFVFYEYIVPVAGFYTINARLYGSCTINAGSNFVISRLMKNFGTTPVELFANQFTENLGSGSANRTFNIFLTYTGFLAQGDRVVQTCYTQGSTTNAVFTTSSSVVLGTTNFEITDTPAQVLFDTEKILNCDYKQIDFIKDIFTLFNLVIVPHKTKPKHFIIETWNDYVASGKIIDWTYKIDLTKDIKIEPLINYQSKEIIFTTKEDTDWYNKSYLEKYKRIWGQFDYISTSSVVSERRSIQTINISATPMVMQGGNNNIGIGDEESYFAPMAELHLIQGAERQPIRPNPRILFYNGTQSSLMNWYAQDDQGNSATYSKYPQMSSYSKLPAYKDSMLLAFSNDIIQNGPVGPSPLTYNPFPNLGTYSVYSDLTLPLYDGYWKDYIDSLYDPRAKLMTADFILTEEDEKRLEFRDVIWIKNEYWRVVKINGLVPDKTTSCKVQLIKLYDYSPFTSGDATGWVFDGGLKPPTFTTTLEPTTTEPPYAPVLPDEPFDPDAPQTTTTSTTTSAGTTTTTTSTTTFPCTCRTYRLTNIGNPSGTTINYPKCQTTFQNYETIFLPYLTATQICSCLVSWGGNTNISWVILSNIGCNLTTTTSTTTQATTTTTTSTSTSTTTTSTTTAAPTTTTSTTTDPLATTTTSTSTSTTTTTSTTTQPPTTTTSTTTQATTTTTTSTTTCACKTYSVQNNSASTKTIGYNSCPNGSSQFFNVPAGNGSTICACSTPQVIGAGGGVIISQISNTCQGG